MKQHLQPTSPLVLVTGATGNVGRQVVHQLLAAWPQVRVRALTRHPATAALPPAVEVVAGDLGRPQSLWTALQGVDRLFLIGMNGMELLSGGMVSAIATLAKKAGLQRLVTLSSSGTPLLQLEEAVEASGLEWTHLRPGEFAANKKDMWGHSIRTEGVVRSAYPDVQGVPVHEADIAGVAVAALLEEGHNGNIYTLTGPEALTLREQVAVIAKAAGRPIRFEELTPEGARRRMVQDGWPEGIADHILEYFAQWAKEPPIPLKTVERITGRPGRTLAQWVTDQAVHFIS